MHLFLIFAASCKYSNIMKHSFLLSTFIISSFLLSCSEDNSVLTEDSPKGMHFTIPDFEFDLSSRTAVEITDQAAVFTWSANDTVGIFPDADASQARFIMTAGAGTKTATFDGGGWALMADKKYASYYPYIPDVNLDKTHIPVNFVGQVQNGNGSTLHLGRYDFMAATAVVPTHGEVGFNYKHLGCLMQIKLTMPKPGVVTSVVLKSTEKIFVSQGKYNLMSNDIAIEPVTLLDSMKIDLTNVQTSNDGEIITVYLMMAPSNLTDKEVIVKAQNENQLVAEGKVMLKNLVAGTAYSFESSLKENVLDEDEEGITNVTTAGTLEDLLGESKYTITQLTVKGNLNSDDIAILRRMSGGYRDTTDVEKNLIGVLKDLDLSRARIVVGGSYYLDFGDKKYRVTKKDQISSNMFWGCGNLESLVLPDNITSIDEAGISSCINLVSITIPNSVTSLGISAFNLCKSLKKIELPQNLTSIGSDAFHSCESLTSIAIPAGVRSIEANTFGHCKNLSEVILTDGLTSIGNGAFAACNSLSSIVIPHTVQSMGERSFGSCMALSNVTLSSGQSELSSYTFENCTSLAQIVIPEGTTSVASRAFNGCINLTDITLPSTLKTLSNHAFYAAAAKLPITVKCYAVDLPTIGTNVWKSIAGSKLYVMPQCVDNYQASTGWKSYFSEILPIE